jgi:hypothetical protein
MVRRNLLKTILYALGTGIAIGFGAGMAIRFSMPRTSEMVLLIMEKLGFDVTDILLHIVDPGESSSSRKPKKKSRTRVSRKAIIPV